MEPADAAAQFSRLSYADFKRLATDPQLSRHERIGFPDTYRAKKSGAILADIRAKMPVLDDYGKTIVDIGPGAGELNELFIDHCRAHRHRLILIDSLEMLAHTPDEPLLRKVAGRFPAECSALLDEFAGVADAVLSYSVLHYVFVDDSLFGFLDAALRLLAPGGSLLLGDIPNVSKRRRFFATPRGIAFHQQFTGTQTVPSADFNHIADESIDDAAIIAILLRARGSGFDGYWLPQAADLPMSNRREDILITRP